MQDQGKRLLLAVVLALGVFLVWSMFAKRDEQVKPGHPANQTASQATGSAAAPALPVQRGRERPLPIEAEQGRRPKVGASLCSVSASCRAARRRASPSRCGCGAAPNSSRCRQAVQSCMAGMSLRSRSAVAMLRARTGAGGSA